MALHPEVLWAQRSSESDEAKNVLFITVNLPDIIESTLEYNLTPTGLSVKAKTGNASKGLPERDYAFDLTFFDEVVPEKSTKKLTSRHLSLVLRKKTVQSDFWPRLTKVKVKTAFIKTDFSKWVDEDEQDGDAIPVDEEEAGGMGGGFPGGMGGMGGGGMGGMGGMGDFDMEKLMAQMGKDGAGGAGPSGLGAEDGEGAEDDDEDEDGPPPLEDAEPAQ